MVLVFANYVFEDLLDGLIEQQKALIVKLEKGRGTIKPEEKAKIMKLLKELSSSIDRTREDIKTSLNVSGLNIRTLSEVRRMRTCLLL